jgi:hypothetical protein
MGSCHRLLLAVALLSCCCWAEEGPPLPKGRPNDVDCAFRELAVRVASRNLGGSPRKLAVVAAGINASDCPAGSSWATRYSSGAAGAAPHYYRRRESHVRLAVRRRLEPGNSGQPA